MKIVIAPDSFKGSLTAIEVSNAIETGVKRTYPEALVEKMPMADGGEGTVQCLVNATQGKIYDKEVIGPLAEPVIASFGILGEQTTAAIEMASASGLPLVPPDRKNPMITTTYGTGQLIKAALDHGCQKMIIGIGGSATNDGGAGMVQALGVQLLDKNNDEIGFGGAQLANLDHIDISGMDERIGKTKILVASDVQNPLCGETGASRIYGPQKGATEEMIVTLDNALSHFADIIKRDLDKDIKNIPGAGAAGGLGAGLMAFLNAELKPGIDIVINTVQLEKIVQDSDLVITGEGEINGSTIYGKTPIGVAKVAKRFQIPVVSVSALIDDSGWIVKEHGIDYLIKPENPTMEIEFPKSRKIELLANTISEFLKDNRIILS
ncbi:MAG: glycerate kinase [Candidatus Cloacimonas sp. SDB]|nr:MAG: glycerate kinase [Candidatus Cloacimonas sp. SDB]